MARGASTRATPSYDAGFDLGKRLAETRWRDAETWSARAARARGIDDDDGGDGGGGADAGDARFPVREDLNALVRVRAIDASDASLPWLMDVDVVSCAASESMRRTRAGETRLERSLHALAGEKLEVEMTLAERARTGGCTMTSACRLPARRIAHCVGPRYAEKYATAAESALCHCFVALLTKTVEECKARTVACTSACTERKGYPADKAAMVEIRTIRRFLEKWSSKLDAVVVCCEEDTMQHYVEALSVFFPRNAAESAHSERVLRNEPEYNEYGEAILSERRLRIDATPGRLSSASDFNKTMGVKLDDYDDDDAVVPAVSSVFMSMSIDPETRRMREQIIKEETIVDWWPDDALPKLDDGLTCPDNRSIEDEQTRRKTLLRRAESVDVSDVSEAKAIYLEKDRDYLGRRVVVVVAAFLERLIKAGEEERLLVHIAKELRGVTTNPRGYVIVYHHAGGAYGAPPSLDFIRKLHIALGPQHKDTLKCVFVVHPTAILKAAIWAMDLLQMESRLFNKVDYVDTVCDLREYVRLEGLNNFLSVPEHVEEYEREQVISGASTIW